MQSVGGLRLPQVCVLHDMVWVSLLYLLVRNLVPPSHALSHSDHGSLTNGPATETLVVCKASDNNE